MCGAIIRRLLPDGIWWFGCSDMDNWASTLACLKVKTLICGWYHMAQKFKTYIFLHMHWMLRLLWVLCFSICSLLKLLVADHSWECWWPLKRAVISKGRAKKSLYVGVYFWSQCPLLRSCEGSIVLHFRLMKLDSLGQRCRQCSMGTRLPACLEARVRCSRPSALRL